MSTPAVSHTPRVTVIAEYTAPLAIYIIRPLTLLHEQKKIFLQLYSVMTQYKDPEEVRSVVSFQDILTSDLIVFCRNYQTSYDYILEEALARNIPTLYVLDDNFWVIPDYIESFYSQSQAYEQFERFLRLCQTIWVYNPKVYERVHKYNPNVDLVTAGIDTSIARNSSPPSSSERITITYLTSRGPKDGLLNIITPALKRILDKYANQVELILWGGLPETLKDYPNIKVNAIDYDYDHFLHSICTSGYDIGLAPITLDEFHSSKTNTKFRDYGVGRIAGVYTDSPVYHEIVNEQTGLVVNNTDEDWFNAIERLILDQELRERIRKNALQYIQEHYDQRKMLQEWETLLAKISQPGTNSEISVQSKFSFHPNPSHKYLYIGASEKDFPQFSHYLNPAELSTTCLLPFADDSFELIILDHVIETTLNLLLFMQELQRISQDGAQICILSQYAANLESLSNPKIVNFISEHSPRFWTRNPVMNILPDDVNIVDLQDWELQSSTAIDNPENFHCFRIEFLYNSTYKNLYNYQRREARHNKLNVCNTILIHLVSNKTNQAEDNMRKKLAEVTPYIPPIFAIQKLHEQKDELLASIEGNKNKIKELSGEIDKQVITNNSLIQSVDQQKTIIAGLQEDVTQFQEDVTRFQANISLLQEERNQLQIARNQLEQALVQEKNLKSALAENLIRAGKELRDLRKRKSYRLIDHLFNRQNLYPIISTVYKQLVDDSKFFNPNFDRFLLQLSDNLQDVAFLGYKPKLSTCTLEGIIIAPIIDLPLNSGYIGVEIVIDQKIITQSVMPANTVNTSTLVQIKFEPLQIAETNRLELRIFARELDMPLRIFEWRKYPLLGLGKKQYQPFIGYVFGA
jgi:glycosyltransferase involved in cell wall biosynthesis